MNMVRSLDLEPPAPIFLLKPVFNVILCVILYFTVFDEERIFLIIFSVVICIDFVKNAVKYIRSQGIKHNFLVVDDLLTYTRKKGYETEVTEEIYLKELILKYIDGDDREDRMVILKSTDDTFKLEADMLSFRNNLENFVEFLSLQERVDEDGDPIGEWTCKSFDETSLPPTPSAEDMEMTAGGLIFAGIFSFFWIGFCSLANTLFLFGSDENTLYVLFILAPFNLVCVVIVVSWVKWFMGRNRKDEVPVGADVEVQDEAEIELRATTKAKQE